MAIETRTEKPLKSLRGTLVQLIVSGVAAAAASLHGQAQRLVAAVDAFRLADMPLSGN
jgi:hypothetical protein